ncbi:Nif11-like leader peptide family natural product precursor [Rhizobium rosettiformans]|uniref:Nif11-like leader peptide family natural product n=2 Tax=Rhizobium rosettiformans TaxID=1368430 RepID=A0ABX7ER67_9HYPH|nr:Nif11-like leader peptide family natural product precursor [Rhizobium rosettiformans]
MMSIDALERFYEHVRSDEALEAQATSALQEGADAVVALGEREGFSFTSEELSVALAHHASMNDELSDDELELVAGGVPARPSIKQLGANKITFG